MGVAETQSKNPLSQLGLFLSRRGRPSWSLTVGSKQQVTPRVMRVVFGLESHETFAWKHGQDLVLELPQPDGSIARRHYTIRAGEPKEGALAIDFVLHGDSPAGRWLAQAKRGDRIVGVGPRGHTYLREADWHLFVGDETGIPGIAAMIEGLPRGAKAFAFLEIADDAECQQIGGEASVSWLARNGAAPGPSRILYDAVESFSLPAGTGQAYVIGETSNIRAIRQRLIARGLGKDRICAEGYWRPGRVGGHDHV
jgi:NADPH-dependent ferric siderophore reductase